MNIFELYAKLGVDKSEFDEGLSDAESRASSAGSTIGGALAKGFGVLAGAATAAVGAAATGIVSLTTDAVNAYGTYEQLVGGVNKLYGDAGDALVENASQAFESAGLSANDYMQTVTGFSASLINALDGDTARAAEIADMAMRDLSDNANTFGTMTTQELSSVYTALAKGNYTLLDNLNLGFAGTQQGMLDLVNASGIFEEEVTDINDVSFDQMLLAIHEVQEQMNIAGTTSNEAASTIQGSLGMLQGAWANLITGLGDSSQDLSPLIDNVVSSAITLVENIRPIATQAIQGIATLISEVAPILAEELPTLIDEILPPLLDAVVLLINTVAATLPSLIGQLLPPIISAVVTITTSLVQALPTILNVLSSQLPVVISQIIPAILEVLPQLIEAGIQLTMALAQGLADNADLLLDSAMSLIHYLVDDLLTPDNIEQFVNVAVEIILTLSEALLTHAPELIGAAIMLISNIIVALAESLPDIAVQVGNFIADLGEDLGIWLYDMFGSGLVDVVDGLASWWNEFVDFAGDVLDNFVDLGADIIATIVDFMGGAGVAFNFDDMISSVTEFGSNLWDDLTGIFENAKTIVSDAIDKIVGFFDFDWSLPDLKLPHFSMTGEFSLDPPSVPSIGVEWYAKAMKSPMLLTDPTIFGISGGKMLGGGEAGDEMVYGREALMKDIREATSGNQQIIIPVYIGDDKIDEIVVNSSQRYDFTSGGRG